jgi:hypothetical protein
MGGLVFAAALLMLPGLVHAKTEFSLGGFIAMYAIWDSTQTSSNLRYINRNNDPNFQHGRMRFSAERTRMNFTIKGPKVFGAITTGYIEWDFDGGGQEYIFNGAPGGGWASPNKARPRLRHAMFRLNWPATELLMGQYWALLSDDAPEAARPGTSGIPGIIWFREPQIRLTQKFLGSFTAAMSIAGAGSGPDSIEIPGDQAATNPYLGQSSETPRISASLKYEQDLWGKAAYYGKPRGFSARVAAGWQRTRYRSFVTAGRIFGENNLININVAQNNQQYLNAWAVDSSFFIPILTTSSANLANTMSLLAHCYVGQGLDLCKEASAANSSYLIFNNANAAGGVLFGDRQLAHQWGALAQLQYYFNNQWFMNLLGGMQQVYGVNRGAWLGTSNVADPQKNNYHVYATLWYRPVQALKFGVEYGYARTGYFQDNLVGTERTNFGENHQVLFVGNFFF